MTPDYWAKEADTMTDYAWFDRGDGRKVYRKVPAHAPQRSALPCPNIRADGMSDTWNPVNGQHYDSRSQYERAVKAAGAEIVGDDKGHWNNPTREYKPEGVREDIVQAWNQLS